MNTLNRLKRPFAVAIALAIPVLNACSSTSNPLTDSPLGDICCTDFKVGADLTGVDFKVDASIAGSFGVFAQAGSDFSGTATGMVDDVTNACKGIATDLGVSTTDAQTADGLTDPSARVKKWCDLAVAQITAQGVAKGTLTISPPSIKCEASVDARAKCQGKCTGSATCDVKATPPTCTGGTLIVQCDGGCDGTATPGGIECQGSCSVAAKGSCTAQGGVQCAGKCEGTCSGSTDTSGNCMGMCTGTCSAVAPNVACNGTFQGTCTGMCTATSPMVKVQCSAGCSANATPIKCTGGKMEGGCSADVHCNASCDASVNAKASCDVQPFEITAAGSASANVGAVIATLKVNLPKLYLAVQARGKVIGEIATNLSGSAVGDFIADPSKLGVKGTACSVAIVAALAQGASNATASIEAGTSLTTSL